MPRDPDEEADKAAFMALDVKLAALKEQMAALKEQIEATFQEKIAVLSEQMNILKKYVSDEGLLAKLKRQQAELSELSESEPRGRERGRDGGSGDELQMAAASMFQGRSSSHQALIEGCRH